MTLIKKFWRLKMEKVLTVSIAAYNVEKYLRECLNSFLDEMILEKCEVIIVDDGSKDGTGEIAKEYVQQYPQTFIYVKKENGGWGSTLNVAMKMAKGKYFKQLDGDDMYDTSFLKDYIRKLEEIDVDVVITPFITFDDRTGENIQKTIILKETPRNIELRLDDLSDKNIYNMHSSTFKTRILQTNNIKITEHCFYTDVEYLLKALNFSDTIMFIDLTIYRYRIARDGQSVSMEGLQKHYQEHLKIVDTLLKYEEKEVRPNRRALYSYNLQNILITQYSIFLKLNPSKNHKNELKEFDKYIKHEYPQYYHLGYKTIEILRKSGFFGYRLAAKFTSMM